MTHPASYLPLIAAAFMVFGLSACEGTSNPESFPTSSGKRHNSDPFQRKQETVFGDKGLNIFGGSKKGGAVQDAGVGIGVNSYLWRASLDTVSFMPLASADPFGGVIITDWYTPPETPGERFKVTIYILDRQLRADGLRVATFKQHNNGVAWENSPIGDNVGRELEDKILSRARELRIQSAEAR